MSLTPGTRLGSYEIVASIGAGGMGEVFRARDTRLDRDVAVKILSSAFAGHADSHPNIVAIHEFSHQVRRCDYGVQWLPDSRRILYFAEGASTPKRTSGSPSGNKSLADADTVRSAIC